jgi:hypothetical protein
VTPTTTDTQRIRSAKRALIEQFGDRTWFRGAGIAPTTEGLGLRLNVASDAQLAEDEIPESFEGFPVEVVRIQRYLPRS